jgi:hypothetical protein
MSEEDTGWWNDRVELEPSKESSSISRPKDKTENSIKQTPNEENSNASFIKGSVTFIIIIMFGSFLDYLGLPIWEILGIIFILLEVLDIFF